MASGYISERGFLEQIFITDDGMSFLQDCERFLMQLCLAKFTIIFNKNFISIIAILAFALSIIGLFKK